MVDFLDPDDYPDIPDGWGEFEDYLFNRMGDHDPSGEMVNDEYVQHWYDKALFHNRELSSTEISEMQEELRKYLKDEYGIDISDAFDWEDYRTWYDNT